VSGGWQARVAGRLSSVVRPLLGCSIEYKLAFGEEEVMVSETQQAILRTIDSVLRENPKSHFVVDEAIAQALGLELQHVRDHLDLMCEDDYITVVKTFGGWSAGLSARGRLILEDPAFLRSKPQDAVLHLVGGNINIGILNTGQIERVESISVSIETLSEVGQSEMAGALRDLAEAIAFSQELAEENRTELLEQLDYLSTQATLEPNKRTKGVRV